jgi:hypothetical protein
MTSRRIGTGIVISLLVMLDVSCGGGTDQPGCSPEDEEGPYKTS